MKRYGNLYTKVYDMDNLKLADARASKGKAMQRGVVQHRNNAEGNLMELQQMLIDKTFTTSKYTRFMIRDPKEREIFRLPYYPDRIVHHAIMNVLEPIFVATFTADTYSCIKGRGIHAASNGLRRALRDEAATTYCLQIDVKKFYPSIDHAILKQLLRRKIKDNNLLWLLDNIIDSADGVPIGNYLSQYFANFYLSYFDHWIKEVMGVKFYFRYADDIVIPASNKPDLHKLLAAIRDYLKSNLNLTVKDNYQIYPVAARGINTLGYIHFHTHVLLRPRIKRRFARVMKKRPNKASRAAYMGWAKHCNSINLLNKIL